MMSWEKLLKASLYPSYDKVLAQQEERGLSKLGKRVKKMHNKEGYNLGIYSDKLMNFVIGEEMKIERTKGEKVKLKELGVGHLSEEAKGQSVKSGKREYASGHK
jgi:hypothetical protein